MAQPSGVRTTTKNADSRIRVLIHPSTNAARRHARCGSRSERGTSHPARTSTRPAASNAALTPSWCSHLVTPAISTHASPTVSPNERSECLEDAVCIRTSSPVLPGQVSEPPLVAVVRDGEVLPSNTTDLFGTRASFVGIELALRHGRGDDLDLRRLFRPYEQRAPHMVRG